MWLVFAIKLLSRIKTSYIEDVDEIPSENHEIYCLTVKGGYICLQRIKKKQKNVANSFIGSFCSITPF